MCKEQKHDAPQRKTQTSDQDENQSKKKPREIGGPKGPEPTRYGDWEKGGRCIDF